MRQALLFLAAMTTIVCAIMLPNTPNRLPTSWQRSIEGRDAGDATTSNAPGSSFQAAPEDLDFDNSQEQRQTVWNPCPQFNVKCVLDGDWRHPVGDLGPKRA
jgi:hypothetical protein